MTPHQFYIFNYLGQKSQKLSPWTDVQFQEALGFIKMFNGNKNISMGDKQQIVDEMKKLYDIYLANPSMMEGIVKIKEEDIDPNSYKMNEKLKINTNF